MLPLSAEPPSSKEIFTAPEFLALSGPAVLDKAGRGQSANSVVLDLPVRELQEERVGFPLSVALGEYQVWSETGKLKRVIIGAPIPGVNYDPAQAPPIDRLTRLTQEHGPGVSPERAVEEFQALRRVLQSFGVTVLSPEPIPGAFNQIYTRDIGMVIGDTLVPANMRHPSRQVELAALAGLIQASGDGRAIATCPDPKATFEGGDILIHDGKLFVGLSERTNAAGISWLVRQFPHLEVVPMAMRKPSADQEALHLDCAFATLGGPENKTALIAPRSFSNIELIRPVLNRWDLIEVTPEEQALLGTNVFSIDPKHVIVRDRCTRLTAELARRGFEPIPLSFDAAASLGGLFRCCTLPVYRER